MTIYVEELSRQEGAKYRWLDVRETESHGARAYKLTRDAGNNPIKPGGCGGDPGDVKDAWGALVDSVPYTTAWDATGGTPFDEMFPTRYRITEIRPEAPGDWSIGVVEFSTRAMVNANSSIDYGLTEGMTTIYVTHDNAGVALVEPIGLAVPTKNFWYKRVETAANWFEGVSGAPHVGPAGVGVEQRRVAEYYQGRVNSAKWLGDTTFKQWLCGAASVRYLSSGLVEVTYTFSRRLYEYNGDVIGWRERDSQGNLKEVREVGNFSNLGLTWKSGNGLHI